MILHIGWEMLGSLRSLQNLFYQSEKKLLVTLHFTLKHNVMKFRICTDYLTQKWKMFSACYQRTHSWKWSFSAFLPPKNINSGREKIKGIMANPSSRDKSRSSNINLSRPKILMTASRLFFYKNDFHYSYVSYRKATVQSLVMCNFYMWKLK